MVLLPENKMTSPPPFCFTGVGRTKNAESPALSGSTLALTLNSAPHQIKKHFEVVQVEKCVPFFKEWQSNEEAQSLATLTFLSTGSDWSCIGSPVCVSQAEVYVWVSASA